MENSQNLLNIYNLLRNCKNEDEVRALKIGLKSEGPSLKTGGSESVGKSRLLSEKSREVDNLIKEIKEHAERRRLVVDLTMEVIEDVRVTFPTTDLVGQGFASHMHEISSFLSINEASGIGVWGMGGVGKTTLIKHLHNMMLTQPRIYGSVYWITISKDCSVLELQSHISKIMRVPIPDYVDESQRAGILLKGVKKKEKFILILDDMWSDHDLNELGLGIPKQNGYRMIVTSRSKLVCSKMHCDKVIKLDPLSNQEALTLFDRNIGREIPDDLRKIRVDVVEECAGLPLAIITLAKSMRECYDVWEWRDVLEKLRNSSNQVDGMEEKVFPVLRLSFERVKDREIKECLLYCATYPEDARIDINDLIWQFIGAGLLGEKIGMTKMFDKGLAILKKLERVALLSFERQVFDEVRDCVCLHDLIRDLAFQIAGSRFMVKAGKGLTGVPDQRDWTEDLEVVSLMSNKIQEVSDFSPNCSKLTALLLKRNWYLSKVSHGFFLRLDELKLLDLSESHITTLPKSISSLKNLTALILRGCHSLIELPVLENLTSLEILDLDGTGINQLPRGIRSLTKLRYLNIFNTNIERTDVGFISKLTALRYLALGAGARIKVQELISLTNLEHLSAVFDDFDSFSTFVEQMNIRGRPSSYTFILGNFKGKLVIKSNLVESEKQIYLKKEAETLGSKSADGNRYCRLAKILFGDKRKSSWFWPFTTWPDTEGRARPFCENELQKLIQDIHLLDIFADENMLSLGDFVFEKTCNLRRGSEMEERGAKPFSNLKSLKLYKCSNLKKLFPLGLLWNLQNMEILTVLYCNNLEELIEVASDGTRSGGSGDSKIVSLRRLRLICLDNLPKLKTLSIWQGHSYSFYHFN